MAVDLGLASSLDVVVHLLGFLVVGLVTVFFVFDGNLFEDFTLKLVAEMFVTEALASGTFEDTEMEFGKIEEVVPDLTKFLLLFSSITSGRGVDGSVFSNSLGNEVGPHDLVERILEVTVSVDLLSIEVTGSKRAGVIFADLAWSVGVRLPVNALVIRSDF